MTQLEIDALCAASGSILGHLTAGGVRTLQALSVNVMAGASVGFFFGPTMADYIHAEPGREAGGICFGLAVVGGLVIPTLLRGLRPWTERNTDNVIGRIAGRVVNMLGTIAGEPSPGKTADKPEDTK